MIVASHERYMCNKHKMRNKAAKVKPLKQKPMKFVGSVSDAVSWLSKPQEKLSQESRENMRIGRYNYEKL